MKVLRNHNVGKDFARWTKHECEKDLGETNTAATILFNISSEKSGVLILRLLRDLCAIKRPEPSSYGPCDRSVVARIEIEVAYLP